MIPPVEAPVEPESSRVPTMAARPHEAKPLETGALGRIDRAMGLLSRTVNLLGVCMILAMMLLTSTDVGLRYCCSAPITGTVELVEFALVIAVFFGLAHTQRMGGNIAADVIDTLLPPRILLGLDLITGVLAAALGAAMTWATWGEAMDPGAKWDTTDMLEVSIWPFKLLAAFGLALLTIELFLNLIRKAFALRHAMDDRT